MDTNRIKHIIAGFEDDIDWITSEFCARYPQTKLTDFFMFWLDEHLDYLFANRFDPRELLEAITSINLRLVRIMTDKSSSNELRLVSLYMAVCIDAKQPLRLRRKLRLTCDDLISLHELAESLTDLVKEEGRLALRQLKRSGVIDLVEERVVFGPSMLVDRGTRRDNLDCDILIDDCRQDTIDFLDKIEPNLTEISRLCVPYEEARGTLRLTDSDSNLGRYLGEARKMLEEFDKSLDLANRTRDRQTLDGI